MESRALTIQKPLCRKSFPSLLFPSIRLGLIDAKNLTLSGDGTAVVSHSSPYGRHLSSCAKDCPYRNGCGRHYSDPDAGWGWDSDNKTWYFGHTLYMLCSRNNALKVELPLLIKFTDARRHDSKNFLYAIDDFGRNAFAFHRKTYALTLHMTTSQPMNFWNGGTSMRSSISTAGINPRKMPLLISHLIKMGILSAPQGIKCLHGAMTP